MTVAAALFVAAALCACGLLAMAWRSDVAGAAAGLPALSSGVGLAGVALSRYATRTGAAASGQELAVLAAVAGLALVILVTGLIGRAGIRRATEAGRPRRRR